MCVVLWLLLLRPRLVIYNISADKLRPILADVVGQFDGDARWAGDSLAIPGLGVQLYMDNFAPLRQRIADFRRRQPESRGLATAGDGSPCGVGSRGGRPQPTRPQPHLCGTVVRRRHRPGHCARSRSGRPLAVGRCPVVIEDDWASGVSRNPKSEREGTEEVVGKTSSLRQDLRPTTSSVPLRSPSSFGFRISGFDFYSFPRQFKHDAIRPIARRQLLGVKPGDLCTATGPRWRSRRDGRRRR